MMKGFSISAGAGSPVAGWARKLMLPAVAGVLTAVLLYMNKELVSTGASAAVSTVQSLIGGEPAPVAAPTPATPAPATPPAVAAVPAAANDTAAAGDSAVAQAGTVAPTQEAGRAGVPGAAAKAAATKAANAASNRVNAQTDANEAASPPATTPAAGAASAAASSAAATTPAIEAAAMIHREVFTYEPEGRRDPFVSLMRTTDLRPALQDLRLTGILFDHSGERPVAIMRETTTNEQFRVTTGMSLGRMRVADIRPKKVIFIIEEFGFSRRDSLMLADPTTKRIQ